MKKNMFVFIGFFLVFFLTSELFSQMKWDYPIKPGSAEWKKFSTHDEMIEACKIPEQVLKTMTTQDLLEAWINYPLKMDIFAFENPLAGLESQFQMSDALKALVKRNDAGKVCLDLYESIEPENIEKLTGSTTKGKFVCDLVSYELLLAKPQIIRLFSLSEKKECVRLALKKIDGKINHSEEGPLWGKSGSLLVINTLESENDNGILNMLQARHNDKNVLLEDVEKDSSKELIRVAKKFSEIK